MRSGGLLAEVNGRDALRHDGALLSRHSLGYAVRGDGEILGTSRLHARLSEASVEESRLAAIRIGQPVSVTLDGVDRTLDARVQNQCSPRVPPRCPGDGSLTS